MMITIHQRNQKFPTTMTLSANLLKIDFLEFFLTNISYITDWHTIPLVLSLPIHFSLFLPSTNIPLFCNVLLSLMTNNSSMNRIFNVRFPIMSKILCLIYPSSLLNLARLRTEKFLVKLKPTKSWNDTNTCSNFTIFLDDKIRATVQLITYTVPQNCLSLFTIHIQNCS